MAGALGLAGPGLMDCSFVTSSKRTPVASSSAASCVSCSASLAPYYNANLPVSGRPQKTLALRSSFTSRSMDSSFWDGGVGACALMLAVEGIIRQSRGGGGAIGAQMNIFERVVRIVRSYANAIVSSAEDPEKLLDQTVLEMNEDLIKMRQASAQVLASQKQLENKYKASQTTADDWYRRAKLALEKGDEMLASTSHLATTSSQLATCTSLSRTKLTPSVKVVTENNINMEIIMETVQQQSAIIIVRSSLLLASLGLLFMARPAFARTTLPPPTSTTSFVDENENKGTVNRNLEPGMREVGPAQSESAKKEKEEDPAELVLQAFLDRHPDDLKTLEGLMYVRLRKGDIGRALEVIDKLLALKPDHAPWQLIRAQSLDFVGDSEQARQAFEAILARDPLSARALQGLATVMLKAGERLEMLEMLKRAVETAVETQQTKEAKNLRMVLGQMHTLQGNYEEALDQYTELMKEDPRDFRPYLCQGLVYTLMNKKVQADSAFRKYRRLCPKTFPERGYLDDLMIGAKAESRRLQELERVKPTAKGAKEPKALRQPYLDTAMASGVEDLQD